MSRIFIIALSLLFFAPEAIRANSFLSTATNKRLYKWDGKHIISLKNKRLYKIHNSHIMDMSNNRLYKINGQIPTAILIALVTGLI